MQATLADILSGDAPDAGKGKLPCSSSDNRKQTSAGSKEVGRTAWEPPPAGWTKVNVDGSFVSQSGEAGISIIARDCKRQVIFMAWSVQFRCHDTLEADAQACLEGFRLAAQWAQGPVIVETDCTSSSFGCGGSVGIYGLGSFFFYNKRIKSPPRE
jgi:hypothetical protein